MKILIAVLLVVVAVSGCSFDASISTTCGTKATTAKYVSKYLTAEQKLLLAQQGLLKKFEE